MAYEHCRKILRKYFSNITYIDDKFDTDLVETGKEIISEDETPDDMPLDVVNEQMSASAGEDNEASEETSVQTEKSAQELSAIALTNTLHKLNERELSGINLMPVIYDETVSDQFIVEKTIKANLTVIDWDLGHGKTALPIIKGMLDQASQLKVVVVYTGGYWQARKSAVEIFGEIEYIKDEKQIMCFQYTNQSKSLVFIVDKQYLNIENILDEVEEIFIQKNGIMPVAVLDIADKLQERSGDIFGAFCKPFEDAYFLQMFYSEMMDNEISNYLSDFIIRKIYSDIHVEKVLGEELLTSKKNALIEVLESHDLEHMIQGCIDQLQNGISGDNAKLLRLQGQLEKDIYRIVVENLKGNQEISWNKIIQSFKPLFKQLKKQRKNERFKEVFGDKDAEFKITFSEIYKKISDGISKDIDIELENYKKEVMPLFLQTLIAQKNFLKSFPELVENLKFHKYEKVDLGHYLRDGMGLESHKKSNFLMNKIHFGDILYDFDLNEYLLCITPPCDAFRPQKTDYKYTFIRGKEVEANRINEVHKENIHITVYPLKYQKVKSEKRVSYIEWKLFDVVTLDLGDDTQYEKICEYKRDYRLDEIYTRQIANKLISHFSRAGVDEIFIKNERNLVSVFT